MAFRAPILGVVAIAGCWSLACSHPERVSAPTVAPDAEPAEPLDWSGQEAMNTEFYIGTRDEEAAEFQRFAREINEIQEKQSKDHSQPIQRGFHAKAHGCLFGHMDLLPERDPRTRFGIFAERFASHPVWVRFSNGVGWSQADNKNDARGMAVKAMNIEG